MNLNSLDFENDFTGSLASVLFVIICAVCAVILFGSIWSASGSFLMSVLLFVLIAPFAAIGVGLAATFTSWLIALLVSGARAVMRRNPA